MIQISDRNYLLSETPITVAQYKQFCDETGTVLRNQPKPQHPNNPVTQVTWHNAVDYCIWLGENYRLPTEDEFEHCCGDHIEATGDIAVFGQEHIKTVKTKQPNKYELYDMLGCVWESRSSMEARPREARHQHFWLDDRDHARCAYRNRLQPGNRYYALGFRVLCSSFDEKAD